MKNTKRQVPLNCIKRVSIKSYILCIGSFKKYVKNVLKLKLQFRQLLHSKANSPTYTPKKTGRLMLCIPPQILS